MKIKKFAVSFYLGLAISFLNVWPADTHAASCAKSPGNEIILIPFSVDTILITRSKDGSYAFFTRKFRNLVFHINETIDIPVLKPSNSD